MTYIGQSKIDINGSPRLIGRFMEHFIAVKRSTDNGNEAKLYFHIKRIGWENIVMIPLQRIYIPDSLLRNKVTVKKIFNAAENFWIHRLDTVTNGLNSKYETHPRQEQKKRRKRRATYLKQRKNRSHNNNDSINNNDDTDNNPPPARLLYNPSPDIFRTSRTFYHRNLKQGAQALTEYTFGKPRFAEATEHLKSMNIARLEAINRWIIEQGVNQTEDQRLVAMIIQLYLKNRCVYIPKQLTVTHHVVLPLHSPSSRGSSL